MQTSEVIISSEEDTRMAVRRGLEDLGMSWDELAAEAKTGRFSSEHACLTWMALSELAEYT
jgi:hypothetical protein